MQAADQGQEAKKPICVFLGKIILMFEMLKEKLAPALALPLK